jgi:hypothetical protein
MIFLITAAFAGELLVMSDSRVFVEVDGRPVSAEGGERGSVAQGLAGGLHRVQVFDAKDRLLASGSAEVGASEQVRLELRKGALIEFGRGPLAGVCAAEGEGGEHMELGVMVGPRGVSVSHSEGGVAVLLGGGHPALSGPVAAPPPPPPVEKGLVAVDGAELASIRDAIEAASFSSDKLGVLRGAVSDRWFTIAQIGGLLDLFAHSSDKLEAAGMLAPRTIDPQNAYKLEERLTFSSDKAAVRRLYAR